MSEDKNRDIQLARDVAAPVKYIDVNGVRYELRFNNRFLREIETVYDAEYHAPRPATVVFGEAQNGMIRAIYAIFYAAARAGGLLLPFAEFEEQFMLTDVDGMQEILLQGISEALPEEKPEAEKN